jgi:hypothetical protein
VNSDRQAVDAANIRLLNSLAEWAALHKIPVILAALPHFQTHVFGIHELHIPYFLDPEFAGDPWNVVYHTLADCENGNHSIIEVRPADAIESVTADKIALHLINGSKLEKTGDSVSAAAIAAFFSEQLKCEITFRRSDPDSPAVATVPAFIKNIRHLRVPKEKPYLSIVVVGRHDGFSKGFELRAQLFLDCLSVSASLVPSANFELIFVDYATPTEVKCLSETLKINTHLKTRVRFIIVPIATHIQYSRLINSSVSFLEYIAKNIGIRRADGAFILVTNPDDIIGSDLFRQIEREEFSEMILYRTNRWSANEDIQTISVAELRDALDDVQSLSSLGLTARCPTTMASTSWVTSVDALIRDAWPCGAGDFLLMSRNMWFAVHGFNEYPGNANVDALFLGKLMGIVPGYIRHMIRTPIIHQYHPRQNIFRPAVRNHENLMKKYACDAECPLLGPFDDTDNWGFADQVFNEIHL